MNIAIFLIFGFFTFSLYALIVEQNLFKKVIFASIIQSSIILLYMIMVWNISVSTPFFYGSNNVGNYVDPVPQVLMLTAIVVGFATTALGLSIVVRIKRRFGTVMYNELEDDADA